MRGVERINVAAQFGGEQRGKGVARTHRGNAADDLWHRHRSPTATGKVDQGASFTKRHDQDWPGSSPATEDCQCFAGVPRERCQVVAAGHEGVHRAQCEGQIVLEGSQSPRLNHLAGRKNPQPPLERRHPNSDVRGGRNCGRVHFAGYRREQHGPTGIRPHRRGWNVQRCAAIEGQAARCDGVIDRKPDGVRGLLDLRRPERAQLGEGGNCLRLGAGDRDRGPAKAHGRQRSSGVEHRAARCPAPVREAVDGEASNDEEVARLYHRSIMRLFFYELHEGASDLLTDAIVLSEQEHAPEAFADIVRAARAAVLDTFEEDTLVEAIARELERSHGFTYVGDDKLRASMSVGVEEVDTFLVEQSDEFRTIIAEMDRSQELRGR